MFNSFNTFNNVIARKIFKWLFYIVGGLCLCGCFLRYSIGFGILGGLLECIGIALAEEEREAKKHNHYSQFKF